MQVCKGYVVAGVFAFPNNRDTVSKFNEIFNKGNIKNNFAVVVGEPNNLQWGAINYPLTEYFVAVYREGGFNGCTQYFREIVRIRFQPLDNPFTAIIDDVPGNNQLQTPYPIIIPEFWEKFQSSLPCCEFIVMIRVQVPRMERDHLEDASPYLFRREGFNQIITVRATQIQECLDRIAHNLL